MGKDKQLETLINDWNNLSQTEKDILGRPNFMCGQLASMMRKKGFECPKKAEMEQALVISTILHFYREHGEQWVDKMSEFLKTEPSQPSA